MAATSLGAHSGPMGPSTVAEAAAASSPPPQDAPHAAEPFVAEAVREAGRLLLPAGAAAALLAAAPVTDVFFASGFPGVTASLSFAHLLCMAPLGVLSTSLLARPPSPGKTGH